MVETECPRCGKIIPLEGEATPGRFNGAVQEAIERGERPKIYCLACFIELDAQGYIPSDN